MEGLGGSGLDMSDAKPIEFVAILNEFHRTIEGIRQVLAIAKPHLAELAPPRHPQLVFADMSDSQRDLIALSLAHRVGRERRSGRGR